MIAHTFYLDFLFKTGLTQSQFLLLHLLYKKDMKYIEMFKERFPTDDKTMIGKILTDDLIKHGWIKVSKTGDLTVTDKFRKLYVTDEIALNELINVYPAFFEKDGVKIPLVTVNKFQYALKYGRKIYNSIDEHNEVLKDLEFAESKGLINFGIAKFIDAEFWTKLRPMRLGEESIKLFDEDLDEEDF